MKKVYKLLLFISVSFLPFSGCNNNPIDNDGYSLVSSSLEDALLYLKTDNDSLTTLWDGGYSSSVYEVYTIADGTVIYPTQSYVLDESLLGRTRSGLTQGIEEIYYSFPYYSGNDSSYQDGYYANYFDGTTWYQNINGLVRYNRSETLDIDYFAWPAYRVDIISDAFLSLTNLYNQEELKENGYSFSSGIYQNEDGVKKVDINLDYSFNDVGVLRQDGYLYLELNITALGNLTSFSYTYSDISFNSQGYRIETEEKITSSSYRGGVSKPGWL